MRNLDRDGRGRPAGNRWAVSLNHEVDYNYIRRLIKHRSTPAWLYIDRRKHELVLNSEEPTSPDCALIGVYVHPVTTAQLREDVNA